MEESAPAEGQSVPVERRRDGRDHLGPLCNGRDDATDAQEYAYGMGGGDEGSTVPNSSVQLTSTVLQ